MAGVSRRIDDARRARIQGGKAVKVSVTKKGKAKDGCTGDGALRDALRVAFRRRDGDPAGEFGAVEGVLRDVVVAFNEARGGGAVRAVVEVEYVDCTGALVKLRGESK